MGLSHILSVKLHALFVMCLEWMFRRRPRCFPTEPRWSVRALSSPGGRTARRHRATSFPALHAGTSRTQDLTALLPRCTWATSGTLRTWSSCSAWTSASSWTSPRTCRSTTTSSACSSTSAFPPPTATSRTCGSTSRRPSSSSVRELCRRKTCHEYFNQEDNLAERESGFILLQQKTNVFIYLLRAVCVCALCIYTSIINNICIVINYI